jgi:hypothetical protein
MRSRAFRRHQMERKKAWAKRAAREWYRSEPTVRQIGLLAHTPKECSCWMCGNQRRIEGDTMQERKYKQYSREGK